MEQAQSKEMLDHKCDVDGCTDDLCVRGYIYVVIDMWVGKGHLQA